MIRLMGIDDFNVSSYSMTKLEDVDNLPKRGILTMSMAVCPNYGDVATFIFTEAENKDEDGTWDRVIT